MWIKRVTADEAARLLGLSRSTIQYHITQGNLPAIRPGRRRAILIAMSDLYQFAYKRGITLSEQDKEGSR